MLLDCAQDDLHRVGVYWAVAPLPSRRSRRCSHFDSGVGVVSAVAPLHSCQDRLPALLHHSHRMQTSTRPDVYAQGELEHPIGLLLCCCSSRFFFRSLVLLDCVQDDLHRVGVDSAVAPLPARRSRRCSHVESGVGVVSAVAHLSSCRDRCPALFHHSHRV